MSQPKISIILPVYNTEQFLDTCLTSILNQTFKEIEVICVDDGSPDNSLRFLKKMAKKDERIKVISQQNQGVSEARNHALQYVNGEFLMYIDSDDWIELDTCEIAYRVALEEKADVVLWSYIREYANNPKPKEIFKQEKIVFEQPEVASKLHRRMVGLVGKELEKPENADAIVTSWGKLYRTALIKENQIKFINTKIIGTEDALFNIYVFGYVTKAVYLNRHLYHYRKDNEISLTSLYKERLFTQTQMKFDLIEKYLSEFNLNEDYVTALNNRIALSLIELGLNVLMSERKIIEKIREIKKILSTERYKTAYQQLDNRYFPIHWKAFYRCAESNFATGVYGLIWLISKLRNGNRPAKNTGSIHTPLQTEMR